MRTVCLPSFSCFGELSVCHYVRFWVNSSSQDLAPPPPPPSLRGLAWDADQCVHPLATYIAWSWGGYMTKKRSDSFLRFLPWMLEAESLFFSAPELERPGSCLWASFLAARRAPLQKEKVRPTYKDKPTRQRWKMDRSKKNPENSKSLDLAMLNLVYTCIFQMTLPPAPLPPILSLA